ncbi:MAG: hypothetical protein RLZZ584_2219 [Pseudomonadota bacterium]|jgi:hypothetical protein
MPLRPGAALHRLRRAVPAYELGVARHGFGRLHHGQALAFQHLVGGVIAAQVGQRVHRQATGRVEEVVIGRDQEAEAPEVVDLVLIRNTRNQLKQVFDALRELMTPPDPPKRPIGFVCSEDKGSKKASMARLKT